VTEQYAARYLGGGEYPVYLTHHKACGAFIADIAQHEKVCTAPPWEPPTVNYGETRDFMADGSVQIVKMGE
jgi:hypothetical protein